MEIQVVKNKQKRMILTPKRGKKRKKEVDEKSNCNYPSILVNTGTNPTVLCWFLSPNQCLILPRSTFLLQHFFADVLLISSKTPPYRVFTFLKKPQTFHSKNISLAYFLLYRKKMNILSPCGFSVLHFQSSFWGRGGSAVLLLFIYVRAHQLPQAWHWSISFFNTPSVHIYTFVLRSKSHKKKVRSSCTLAQSTAFCSKRELRPTSFIFARHPTATASQKKKKSVLLHRQFFFLAPTPFGRMWGSTAPTSHPSGRPLLQRSD